MKVVRCRSDAATARHASHTGAASVAANADGLAGGGQMRGAEAVDELWREGEGKRAELEDDHDLPHRDQRIRPDRPQLPAPPDRQNLANAGLQVVAINDLYDAATLAHLLEYDSTFGRLDAPVLVLPELAGRLDGVALRVPVVDGSISDLSLVLATEVTAEQINRAVAASAAAGQPMHGIIRYAEAPLVSTDIVGDFDDDTEQAIAGPVLAGILAARSAEDVLRCAFAEAQRRDVALHVLAAGPSPAADDDVLVRDLVDRWAEKYPAVPVTVSRRHDIDAVITLNGASRRCGLVVVAEPADGHDVAVVRALTRRAHCPLMVAAPVR